MSKRQHRATQSSFMKPNPYESTPISKIEKYCARGKRKIESDIFWVFLQSR